MKRLILFLVLLLSTSVSGQLNPEDFILEGGFRISPQNTGFAEGGAHVHFETERGLVNLLLEGSIHDRTIQYQRHFLERMTPGDDFNQWQLLVHRETIPVSTMFGFDSDTYKDGYQHPQGVLMEDSKWFVSVRSRYATKPDPDKWIATRENGEWTTHATTLSAQKFGGGFLRFPKDIADKYFEGNDFALGSGGLTSGQRGAAGPTLCLVDINFKPIRILLDYATTAEIGEDKVETWERTAPAFGDYFGGTGDQTLPGWVHPVKVIDGERVGRFGTSSIKSGPTFIRHPRFTGVMYVVTSPVGLVTYAQQTESLANDYATTLYFYDIEDLAKVYRGEIEPHQTSPHFVRWKPSIPGRARAATWVNGRLWVYFTRVWKKDVEANPVLASYRLPDLEPEPKLEERVESLEGKVEKLYQRWEALLGIP